MDPIVKKRFLVRRELAEKDWENNGLKPNEISAKYKVSLSTAYRWVSEWEAERK